jgi:CheY-like chemotaxis protein
MEPGLQALLLCDDDKVVRVLRRVLSELEIGVEHCTDPDAAIQKITRQRFEAVIIDCTIPEVAARVLKGTRSAPANKRAIAVAIIDSLIDYFANSVTSGLSGFIKTAAAFQRGATRMKCDMCCLINPPTASRCDCGYDLE